MYRRDFTVALAAGPATAALAAAPALVRAADYPAKATRIVVPLSAGGPMDAMGRSLGTALSEALGQAFYVENRPGAAGQLAGDAVAKAAGDPYTLFIGSMGIMSLSPLLYPTLPYDVARDFTPIALCGHTPYALVVSPPVVAARTVGDFLQWARGRKAPLPYGTVGSGSVAHIAGVMLASAASLELTQVPYRGPTQMTTDLVKGDLPMVMDAPSPYVPFASDGRLRLLAVTTRQRSTLAPELPTMEEAGVPGFDLSNWFGLFAPRDLPPAAVARLRGTLATLLASRRIREQFVPLGVEPPGDAGKDFPGFVQRDRERWRAFIKRHDIKLDKA
jgi:tripartite-type tricarboxylate transporter receptor subunit TctC